MAAIFERSTKRLTATLCLLFWLTMATLETTGAQSIGVCYGGDANNLPSDNETIDLYRSNGIGKMRIYSPSTLTLQALRGSNIELILGVPNSDLQSVATNASSAAQWVSSNILTYSSDVKFRYIAVGNEVIPTSDPSTAQYVGPAMQNIHDAISAVSLGDQIKVSTAIDLQLLEDTYPPSNGSFSEDVRPFIDPVIDFLVKNGSPLLANIYPYFTYIYNKQDINLTYALFTAPEVVVKDGIYEYKNLFDALLDAMYSALEKAGGAALEIIVSESGWPSDGGDAATLDNAETYYKNLINHVEEGSPKKAGQAIETYLFAMYDENLKGPAEIEKHFGLFSPDKQPKYQLSFS